MSAANVTERPDWVRCVLTSVHDTPVNESDRTWCGRVPPITEWCFNDASHAALSAKRENRLVACPACTVAIVRALWSKMDDGPAPGERSLLREPWSKEQVIAVWTILLPLMPRRLRDGSHEKGEWRSESEAVALVREIEAAVNGAVRS